MNTTQLLASIARGITVPANQNRFSSTDLLALADEETQTKLIPALLSIRQEYLVRTTSTTLVAGQKKYAIPSRAIGRTVRQISYVTGNSKFNLPYIQPEDSQYYANNGYGNGQPSGYYFEGDSIILLPTPISSTDTIEIKFEIQCSSLTDVANAAKITAINTSGNYVTLDAVPSAFTIGALIDFVQFNPGNNIIEYDYTITNVSGNNVYFTALPNGIAVNDWLSPAGTTPVIQLPQEMHQVLAQAVECRVLEGLGDFEGLQASSAKLQEKTQAMLTLLSPRQKGSQQKIMNRNGLLSRGGSSRSRSARWGL